MERMLWTGAHHGSIPRNQPGGMGGIHGGRARFLALLFVVLAACERREATARKAAQGIDLRQKLVLSPAAGAEFQMGAQVVRDSRGWYYANRLMNPATIAVFDGNGRLRHTFGNRGGGPGELDGAERLFVSPGDSLFVVDRSNQVTVFSPDHRFIRSFRPRVSIVGMAFAPDGRLVISNYEPLSLPALVLTGRDGQSPTALGSRSSERDERPRLLAHGDSGAVWAAFRDRYRIELLDVPGGWRRTIERRLPWFGPEPDRRRETAARGAIRDYAYNPHTGTLSVLLSRTRQDFKPPAAGPAGGEGRPVRLSAEQLRARFDLFLEVLDARSGQLLAAGDLGDRIVGGFISPTEIYGFEEREDGTVTIGTWEISLSNRNQPGR